MFVRYFLDSFSPFLFCFARKMRGNNSKTARFICPPDSTFIHISFSTYDAMFTILQYLQMCFKCKE